MIYKYTVVERRKLIMLCLENKCRAKYLFLYEIVLYPMFKQERCHFQNV